MQAKGSCSDARPPARSRHERSIHDQGIVLMNALDRHPVSVTTSQLLQEITHGSENSAADQERLMQAVRFLSATGLIRFYRALIVPTAAAVRFNEITEALA
jgi:hypothetical protein